MKMILLISLLLSTIYSHEIPKKSVSDELLEVVLRSPYVVGMHLKEDWLNLFSLNSSVEDPVGTSAHSGIKDLSSFWKVFIARVNVTFIPDFNIVNEQSLEVVRNVNISATLESGVRTIQPAIILYKLVKENNTYKINSLQAHWVLIDRIKETLFQKNGITSILSLGYTLLNEYGISGVMGYMKGFIGIHEKGKTISKSFFEEIQNKNKSQWIDFFYKNNETQLKFSYHNTTFISKGVDKIGNFFEEHIIKNNIILRYLENKIYPSGWKIAGVLEISTQGRIINGVYIFEFDNKTHKILNSLITIDVDLFVN